ncbi:hypothetical protein, partial [Alistipes ihumii]|uniref:hypothetical protein n=1 Tax=Alistipes ihumii TaxID=1470347 RepID=UPI00307A4C45
AIRKKIAENTDGGEDYFRMIEIGRPVRAAIFSCVRRHGKRRKMPSLSFPSSETGTMPSSSGRQAAKESVKRVVLSGIGLPSGRNAPLSLHRRK